MNEASTILDDELQITLDDVVAATKERGPWPDGTIATVQVVEAGDPTNGTAQKGPKTIYVRLTFEAIRDDGDTHTVYHKQTLLDPTTKDGKRKAMFKSMAARFLLALGYSEPSNMSALYASLVRLEPGAAQQLVGATGRVRLRIGTNQKGRSFNEIDRWILPNGAGE